MSRVEVLRRAILFSFIVFTASVAFGQTDWTLGSGSTLGTAYYSGNIGIGDWPTNIPLLVKRPSVFRGGTTYLNAAFLSPDAIRGVWTGYDTSGNIGILAPWNVNSSLAFWMPHPTTGAHFERMRFSSVGLGIGRVPQFDLDVTNNIGSVYGRIESQGSNAAGLMIISGTQSWLQFSDAAVSQSWMLSISPTSITGAPQGAFTIFGGGAVTAGVPDSGVKTRLTVDLLGKVGIGVVTPTARLDVGGDTKVTGNITVLGDGVTTGNITVAGNINAKYQDVAEWVPATAAMTAGTVVVLNRERHNEVQPSVQAYDTAVAGVVSAQPGLILGEAGDMKAMIATTGRVKVHVTAGGGAISVGDLLVSSDKSGVAMKSNPIELQGRKFHQPGTIIGKALEPLASGDGEILVLLSLQ